MYVDQPIKYEAEYVYIHVSHSSLYKEECYCN